MLRTAANSIMQGHDPTDRDPTDHTALIAGVVVAVVLFLLLLGASIIATGFYLAAYQKRKKFPVLMCAVHNVDNH